MSALTDLIFKFLYLFRGVPVSIDGVPLRLDESLRRWNIDGEEALQKELRSRIKPGDLVVDIGANFGLHTLYAAHLVSESGQVVAFEPVPANLALLRRNLHLSKLTDRVDIQAAAVSNSREATLEIFCPDEAVAVTASLANETGAGTPVQVANLRLEEFEFPDGRAPAVIKIDVEGAEFEVLKGARGLLARDSPVLLIEIHEYALGDFRTSVTELETFLADLGYYGSRLSAPTLEREDYYQAVFEKNQSTNLHDANSDR